MLTKCVFLFNDPLLYKYIRLQSITAHIAHTFVVKGSKASLFSTLASLLVAVVVTLAAFFDDPSVVDSGAWI